MVQRRGGKLMVQRREGKTDGRKEGGKGVGEDCWYKEGGGKVIRSKYDNTDNLAKKLYKSQFCKEIHVNLSVSLSPLRLQNLHFVN